MESKKYTDLTVEQPQENQLCIVEDRGADNKFSCKGSSRRIFKMIAPPMLLLLANYLYVSASINCPYPDDRACNDKFIEPNQSFWVTRFCASAILFSLLVLLGISYTIIPRKISILAVASVIYLTYFHNRSIEHGNYSIFFGFYTRLLIIFLLGFFYVSRLLLRSFKRRPRLTLLIIHAFVALVGIAIYHRVANSCSTWDYGLDGERVVYDTTTCNLKKPDLCVLDIRAGLFDYNRLQRWDCTTFPSHWELMDKYFGSHPLVGYPRTEYISDQDRYEYGLPAYLQSNLVPIESLEDEKAKDLEIILDRRNPKDPKYIIKVKRNETLVEERSRIKSPSVTKNLLVIYIDTLSRARAMKNTKSTMAWIEKFMNQKHPSREAFQFFKYHSITPFTLNNLFAALHGVFEPLEESQPTVAESFVETFKRNGYITGRSTDYCVSEFIFYNDYTYSFLRDTKFDHEGIAFSCDPNVNLRINFYPVRRCMYGKDLFEYQFEYALDFWKTYQNEKKLLYMDFIMNHEYTQERVKYMDEPLAQFLQSFEERGWLEDTAILFFSDHGLHFPQLDAYYYYDIIYTERALPTLFIILPRKLSDEYRLVMKENQQKFVSAFTVYHTFMTIAEGVGSSHFKSSLMGNLPLNTTCDDIRIYKHACYCTYDHVFN